MMRVVAARPNTYAKLIPQLRFAAASKSTLSCTSNIPRLVTQMPFSAHAAQAESEPMKISVAMCTFNGEPYLQEQLNSFARQTRPPDELVICDDRSSDETRTISDSFARTAGFPVIVAGNEQTFGSPRNFEQAVSRCSGDIIALSDQDDVWLPAKLALLEAQFGKSARVGLVFSDAEVVDQDLRPTGRRMWNEVGPLAVSPGRQPQ